MDGSENTGTVFAGDVETRVGAETDSDEDRVVSREELFAGGTTGAADVDAATLDHALRTATKVSFDRLDSDGCMSTNDTVLLLASGASGTTPPYDELRDAVKAIAGT